MSQTNQGIQRAMKYHNITGRQQENKSLAEKTLTPQKLACVCIIFIQDQVLKQFGSFHKYLNVLVVCGLYCQNSRITLTDSLVFASLPIVVMRQKLFFQEFWLTYEIIY